MRRLLAVMLLAVLTACGGDGGTGPSESSIVGTYALISIGGDPVPSNVTTGGASFVVNSGTLNMNADGTCSYSLTAVQGTIGAPCTYVRQNDSFVLTGQDGSQVTGSFIGGNTITFVDSGFNMTWRK